MQTISIIDSKPEHIIKSVANFFNVNIKVKRNTFCVKIPVNYGEGHVKLFTFPFGVSTLEVKVNLKKQLHLNYESGYIHPLKIILVKNGKLIHSFNTSKNRKAINNLESVVLSSTPNDNHSLELDKNSNIHFISIQINRKKFDTKVGEFIMDMHSSTAELIRDLNGVRKIYHESFMSTKAIKVFDEFTENNFVNFIESIFLEAKTYELIAIQLKQYASNLKSPNTKVLLLPKTLQRIKKAVDIIEKDIGSFSSVEQLAKQLNINKKTLQSGFKKLFNSTVNAYIKNFKAKKVKYLLDTSVLSVAEISYQLDLSSPSYLSRLFKSHYGLSPTEYRQKIRKN